MIDVRAMIRYGLLVLTAVGAAGCGEVYTVSPLVSGKDVQYDSLLVGAWRLDSDSSGSVESLRITPLESDRYAITYTDNVGKIARLRGTLGRVATFRVLDVEPEDPREFENGIYGNLFLPLHVALFVDSLGTELSFSFLALDSLGKYLEREPDAIAHFTHESDVVLTAPTEDLQRFLAGYVSRAGALSPALTWKRILVDSPRGRSVKRGGRRR